MKTQKIVFPLLYEQAFCPERFAFIETSLPFGTAPNLSSRLIVNLLRQATTILTPARALPVRVDRGRGGRRFWIVPAPCW